MNPNGSCRETIAGMSFWQTFETKSPSGDAL